MSKMPELDLTVKELRQAASSLTATADNLATLFGGSAAESTETATLPKAKETKPVALEDVRAVLAEKSRAGYTAEVRELLLKHGASKLSEIDPAKYQTLLEDAEVLGNG
jgi:DNA-directed RNA polymerase